MTDPSSEKTLTKEEMDNLPLTRKQMLQVFEELHNYLTMGPHLPIPLRTLKERVHSYVTLAPIPVPIRHHVDGGNRTWAEVGRAIGAGSRGDETAGRQRQRLSELRAEDPLQVDAQSEETV